MKKNSTHIKNVYFSFGIALLFFVLNTTPSSIQADETYDLTHQVKADETLNIKSQVQYVGSVIVDGAGQDEDARVLPLDVRAQFDFDQRISAGSTTSPQAIRHFDKAYATISAGKGKTESKLDKSNHLVLARLKDTTEGTHQVQIASIGGILRQKEYELLKNPGDPLAYANLLDKKNVKVGEKWDLRDEQIIGLLTFNRIVSSSMKMMLKSVENNEAKIYIYGSVKGEVDDVIAEQKVKGIFQLDLNEKRVAALRLSIDEERRTGQVAPGFEGKIKLDTRITPTSENVMMRKERLAEIYKGKKIKFAFLFDRSDNEFQLKHNTKWRVIASEEEAAVLRYIDDGQLIAQCNVVQLPRRPVDKPLELSQFQTEVQKIIAESEARIVNSDQWITSSGYSALHVSVDGTESGIPFMWLYYHVAAQDGRRVTFVYTLEKDSKEYFGSADRKLVDSITFKKPRQSTASAYDSKPATKR